MSKRALFVTIGLLMMVSLVAACAAPAPAAPTTAPTAPLAATSVPAANSAPAAVAPSTKVSLDMTAAKVRYGSITGIAYPTFIAAQEKGFFTKENLTVEVNMFNGSGPVTDAIAAGNIDIGNTTPSSGLLASVKGAKVIQVSGHEATFIDKSGKSWEAAYLIVRSGEGIQKLADLKGKKVAINDIGSLYNYTLRAQMLALKIDPDKDMTIVPVPFSQMPAALMQKQVDAAIVNADGYIQAQSLGKVDVIATHTSLEGDDFSLSSSMGVNTDYLQKNPDVVVRFLRALIESRQWLQNDVEKNNGQGIIDIVMKSMKYSKEKATSLYDTRAAYYGKDLDFANLLDIPVRLMNRQYEILKANNLIKSDVPDDYNKAVDIKYLKEAFASLGIKWDDSKH